MENLAQNSDKPQVGCPCLGLPDHQGHHTCLNTSGGLWCAFERPDYSPCTDPCLRMRTGKETKRYRVMCVTWYEEEAETVAAAKAIVESNCPGEYAYMRAEVIP